MSKFYFWGPLLLKTQVEDKNLELIKNLCNKDENLNYRDSLAGHIHDEYKIDCKKLQEYLKPNLIEFTNCFAKYYDTYARDLKISGAWVNYMKKGEFNPPHTHDSDFSAVLFLNVPDELKKEQKEHEKIGVRSNCPGSLSFLASVSSPNYFINSNTFFPEKGNMFIFPARLIHFVFPFKSDIERVSIAYNIEFISKKTEIFT